MGQCSGLSLEPAAVTPAVKLTGEERRPAGAGILLAVETECAVYARVLLFTGG